jgi:hypothetical protein
MQLLLALAVFLFLTGAAMPASAQYERYYDRDPRQFGQVPAPRPDYGRPRDVDPGRPSEFNPDRPRDFEPGGRRDRGLRIIAAWYGLEDRACDATRSVRRICEDDDECTVKATNRLCGDPVPGVVKVLTVWYRCGGRPREITRWEGSYLGLRCYGYDRR